MFDIFLDSLEPLERNISLFNLTSQESADVHVKDIFSSESINVDEVTSFSPITINPAFDLSTTTGQENPNHNSFFSMNISVESGESPIPINNLVASNSPTTTPFGETGRIPFTNDLEAVNTSISSLNMFSEWVPSEPFNNDNSWIQHLPYSLPKSDEKAISLANESSHSAQYPYYNDNLRNDSLVSLQDDNNTSTSFVSRDEYDSSDYLSEIFLPIPKPDSLPFPENDNMDVKSNMNIHYQQFSTRDIQNKSLSSLPAFTAITENQIDATPLPRPIPPAPEEKKKTKKRLETNKKQSHRKRLNFSGKDERILIMKWISKLYGGSTYIESAGALFKKYYDLPLQIGTRVHTYVRELNMNVTITIGRTATNLYHSFNSMKNRPELFTL